MFKIIFAILVVLNSNIATANGYKNKIVVVDVQTILDNSKAVSQIRNHVEQKNAKLQQELNELESELKKREAELIKQKDAISESEFDKEVIKFNKKVTKAQKKIQESKVKLEQSHSKAISKVNEVALDIIEEISMKQNYLLVLPSNQVLFANEKLNITSEVLKLLDKKIPKVNLEF